MLPEISRRCRVCGASPRAGAQFCPQCGNRLSERERDAEGAGSDARPNAGAQRDGGAEGEAARADEIARAFEAWRGGEVVASGEEARGSAAAEPQPTLPAEVERQRTPPAEVSRPAAAEVVRPAAEGGADGPQAGGELTPEPLRARAATTLELQGASGAGSGEAPPSGGALAGGALTGEPLAERQQGVGGEAGEAEDAAASSAPPPSRAAGAVGATRRRAASVVKESIAPRVERVRDRSIVMLEESPGDSGLRFVLVAALMFALFVFLLVLSTVIK